MYDRKVEHHGQITNHQQPEDKLRGQQRGLRLCFLVLLSDSASHILDHFCVWERITEFWCCGQTWVSLQRSGNVRFGFVSFYLNGNEIKACQISIIFEKDTMLIQSSCAQIVKFSLRTVKWLRLKTFITITSAVQKNRITSGWRKIWIYHLKVLSLYIIYIRWYKTGWSSGAFH